MARPRPLDDLLGDYRCACNDLREALEAAYPTGTKWLVRVNSRQKTPSVMEVIGHDVGWECLVRFSAPGKPKRFGYGRAKTFRCYVPLDRILCQA